MLDSNVVNTIFALLASLGLSLSAGIRAYLPILAVGIAADLPPTVGFHLMLRPGFEWIGNPFFLVLIGFLTIYEFTADKIPLIDHLNDAVHTIIRPLAGALIFTAISNPLSDASNTGAIIAALVGGGLAGTTHAVKAGVVRPTSTATTAGLANPLVSLVEDVFVFFTAFFFAIIPLVGAILFALAIWLVVRGLRRRARRRQAQAGLGTGGGGMLPMDGQFRPPEGGGGGRR